MKSKSEGSSFGRK